MQQEPLPLLPCTRDSLIGVPPSCVPPRHLLSRESNDLLAVEFVSLQEGYLAANRDDEPNSSSEAVHLAERFLSSSTLRLLLRIQRPSQFTDDHKLNHSVELVGELYSFCSTAEMLNKQRTSTTNALERLPASVIGDTDTRLVNQWLAMKSFQRSDASKVFRAIDLRPAVFCRRAVQAIIALHVTADISNAPWHCSKETVPGVALETVAEFEQGHVERGTTRLGHTLLDVYNFARDRLRAVWQDLTVQHCPTHRGSLESLEISYRFLLMAEGLLAETEGFDTQQNSDLMATCLDKLMSGYALLHTSPAAPPSLSPTEKVLWNVVMYRSQHQAEFWAYRIIATLAHSTGNPNSWLDAYCKVPVSLRSSERVRFAMQVHRCFRTNNFPRFYKFMGKADFLTAVLMQRYSNLLRLRWLTLFNGVGRLQQQMPFETLKRQLGFACEPSTIAVRFCEAYGLHLDSDTPTTASLGDFVIEASDLHPRRRGRFGPFKSQLLASKYAVHSSDRQKLLDPDFYDESPASIAVETSVEIPDSFATAAAEIVPSSTLFSPFVTPSGPGPPSVGPVVQLSGPQDAQAAVQLQTPVQPPPQQSPGEAEIPYPFDNLVNGTTRRTAIIPTVPQVDPCAEILGLPQPRRPSLALGETQCFGAPEKADVATTHADAAVTSAQRAAPPVAPLFSLPATAPVIPITTTNRTGKRKHAEFADSGTVRRRRERLQEETKKLMEGTFISVLASGSFHCKNSATSLGFFKINRKSKNNGFGAPIAEVRWNLSFATADSFSYPESSSATEHPFLVGPLFHADTDTFCGTPKHFAEPARRMTDSELRGGHGAGSDSATGDLTSDDMGSSRASDVWKTVCSTASDVRALSMQLSPRDQAATPGTMLSASISRLMTNPLRRRSSCETNLRSGGSRVPLTATPRKEKPQRTDGTLRSRRILELLLVAIGNKVTDQASPLHSPGGQSTVPKSFLLQFLSVVSNDTLDPKTRITSTALLPCVAGDRVPPCGFALEPQAIPALGKEALHLWVISVPVSYRGSNPGSLSYEDFVLRGSSWKRETQDLKEYLRITAKQSDVKPGSAAVLFVVDGSVTSLGGLGNKRKVAEAEALVHVCMRNAWAAQSSQPPCLPWDWTVLTPKHKRKSSSRPAVAVFCIGAVVEPLSDSLTGQPMLSASRVHETFSCIAKWTQRRVAASTGVGSFRISTATWKIPPTVCYGGPRFAEVLWRTRHMPSLGLIVLSLWKDGIAALPGSEVPSVFQLVMLLPECVRRLVESPAWTLSVDNGNGVARTLRTLQRLADTLNALCESTAITNLKNAHFNSASDLASAAREAVRALLRKALALLQLPLQLPVEMPWVLTAGLDEGSSGSFPLECIRAWNYVIASSENNNSKKISADATVQIAALAPPAPVQSSSPCSPSRSSAELQQAERFEQLRMKLINALEIAKHQAKLPC